jgi:soluble lytic murein transglycosylase-like protein
MNVQKAVFPGFLIGCVAVFMLARLIAVPTETVWAKGQVSASTNDSTKPTKSQKVSASKKKAINSTCSLSDRYPDAIRQWCDMIEKYAAEYEIDPQLIAAVMLQESGGNPQAYSSSGAVGLMQIMPRDGIAASFMCANGPCFSSRPSMDELYDPDFNISYGARMLAGLINKHGSIRDGLQAYGPMDVGYYYADLVIKIMNTYR